MALTKKDIKTIDELIGKRLSENNEVLLEHFASKDELKEVKDYLEDKIKHLPTKDEFYKANDKLMKELRALREEVVVSIHQTRRNTGRIEKLELKVFGN